MEIFLLFQGEVAMALARFLRPFFHHGRSVSPPRRERTVLYRVLFHYFDRFLAEYQSRFEKQYGFLRPIPSKGWAEMIRKVD
jgi:hypothetical protein